MPATLASNAQVSVNWTYTNSLTAGDVSIQSGFRFTNTMTTGTGATQSDLLYVGSPTIVASGTLTLDLAGSLLDVFGNTLTFVRIKGFVVTFQAANTGSEFSIGDNGTNQFFGFFNANTNKEKVYKTGCFFKWRDDATAWPVVATTGDLIKITNLDGVNSILLNIAIIGSSV